MPDSLMHEVRQIVREFRERFDYDPGYRTTRDHVLREYKARNHITEDLSWDMALSRAVERAVMQVFEEHE